MLWFQGFDFGLLYAFLRSGVFLHSLFACVWMTHLSFCFVTMHLFEVSYKALLMRIEGCFLLRLFKIVYKRSCIRNFNHNTPKKIKKMLNIWLINWQKCDTIYTSMSIWNLQWSIMLKMSHFYRFWAMNDIVIHWLL